MTTIDFIAEAALEVNELKSFNGELEVISHSYSMYIIYELKENYCGILNITYQKANPFRREWRRVGGIYEFFNEDLFKDIFSKLILERKRELHAIAESEAEAEYYEQNYECVNYAGTMSGC